MEHFSLKPILTIKEAKKILGSASNNLTDEEIAELIIQYDQIAKIIIKDYMVLNNKVMNTD